MSETDNPGATDLTELMRRVLASDACEAFDRFSASPEELAAGLERRAPAGSAPSP